ncbi:MAG: hypothetical protein Q7T05_03215 [Dehalococcoidia bacterium]|nr:hypothetical protein [Dehalococcoidia bacterium]
MAITRDCRSKLAEELELLSDDRVKAVADFAAYLREREEWEETAEILGDKGLARQIKKSRKAWSDGRKENFLSLDDVKAGLEV